MLCQIKEISIQCFIWLLRDAKRENLGIGRCERTSFGRWRYEAREIPIVQELDAKVKELRQTIAALNNNQMSLRASFRKLKEKTGEMDEKRAIEERKSAREEAMNAERSAMQTYHEKSAIVEVYTKVHRKMSKHFVQMQAIQEQANSAKTIEKDLKALKAKLSDEEVLEKSLEAKLVERQAKVEQLEELRKQLEKERDIKCEEATKYLNSVKSEVESKRHALEERRRNVEAVVAEVDTVSLKINSVEEAGGVKLELLDSKCKEIVKEYQCYANSIAALLPGVESGLKLV